MKILMIFLISFFLMSFLTDEPFISNDDLSILQGEKWIGSLTYKDYQSGKEVNIPANLSVIRLSDSSDQWIFSFEYPDEPHAGNIDTVIINDGGKNFDGETVIERSVTPEGFIKIVTTKSLNEKTMRYTYMISDSFFSSGSEEKGIGNREFFQRNLFVFKRY